MKSNVLTQDAHTDKNSPYIISSLREDTTSETKTEQKH